jgi:hypothetical protein
MLRQGPLDEIELISYSKLELFTSTSNLKSRDEIARLWKLLVGHLLSFDGISTDRILRWEK